MSKPQRTPLRTRSARGKRMRTPRTTKARPRVESTSSLQRVLDRLECVRRSGRGWQARCPAHKDRQPSLSIHEESGKILLHCHAGCGVDAICQALGLEVHELFTDNSSSSRVVATYDYQDESGAVLFQVVRYDPKAFKQRRPDGKGGWAWNLDGVRRVLYSLPELRDANDVLIVEGEKDCQNARQLGFVATCNSGGAGKWRDEYSECLRGKRIVVVVDADEPGRRHAQQVATSLAGKVESLKVIELPGSKDLSEWKERGGRRDQLLDTISHAREWKLQTVDAGAMLNDIYAFIRRFVSLSPTQARVIALWIAHTHAIDAADATPYLAITSAEKQSGKSRLLEICELLVAEAWMTGRVSAAVLVRKIDASHPTLLLDESDAAFNGSEEYVEALRGVLNTGHRRGGRASCCVGQGKMITFRDFSTFCPKAIAGIGSLPDTVADRSIPIRLKRALRSEGVERFRRREVESIASGLRERIQSWALAAKDSLRNARPALPSELTDRQQDGAEPLLAIADAAGGEWPEVSRQSIVSLCTEAQASDESVGVRLLADIRAIFHEHAVDRIASADLAEALAGIETSPWGEFGRTGKPLSAAKLARLLGRYVVVPSTIRIGEKTAKGYKLDDFSEAFGRYLPASLNELQSVTNVTTSQGTAQNPNKNGGCDVVTLYPPPTGTLIAWSEGPPEGQKESLIPLMDIPVEQGQSVTTSQPNTDAGFRGADVTFSSNVTLSRKLRPNQAIHVPRPVRCVSCGEMQESAVALSHHLKSCPRTLGCAVNGSELAACAA